MNDQDSADSKKAEIALEFLKHFYVSDISDEIKRVAKLVLLDYFNEP